MRTKGASLAGFMIGGYRSFYGEPQRVGPLTKVTLVAGPNNSGKSNILRAADRLLPSLESGRGKEFKLDDELDVPIMPDEGVDAPPFTLGVALRVQSGGHLDSLMSALPERPQAGTQGMQFVNQLAFAPAFRSTPADNELVWFRWWFDGQHLKRDDGQLEELADHMRNSGLENLISDMASTTFGRSEGTVADLGQFMDAWEGAVRIPPVAFVPAIRQIMIGDDFGPELRDTSGKGLPRMLQAWQAPSATRYLQDRLKYSRIDDFLKTVLENESAEILVPYDSKTVHVSLENRVLPLENLGSGISQVILLAVIATWYENHLVCLEEPENDLHPVLLRKLVRYLANHTSNQYLISTHSAHMLDDPNVTVLRVSYETMNGTIVEPAITNAQRAAVSQHLGYRASDLIQANAIVWVEGPSDRVYLNHWIHARDPRLIEGVHYSVMFYGGRLLAHLTGEEMDTPDRNVAEFISLLQINRNMVIVIDSDKRTADTEINETKQRIVTEFKASGGIAWVTQGREIENYVPEQVFASATRASHPTTSPAPTGDQYEDRFASIRAPRTGSYEGKVKAPDKVRVAEEAVALSANSVWNCLDLIEQVDAVVAYLCAANDLPLATPSDGARGVPTWE